MTTRRRFSHPAECSIFGNAAGATVSSEFTTYSTFPTAKEREHENLENHSSSWSLTSTSFLPSSWSSQPIKQEFVSILYRRITIWLDSPLSLKFFHQVDHGEQTKQCRYALDQLPWRVIVAVSVCFCLSFDQVRSNGELEAPEWKWDHNIYAPRQQHASASGILAFDGQITGKAVDDRNMLLAQIAGGNEILKSLGEICSRPNRAYARQWSRDYVQYAKSTRSSVRSCFDKVTFLSTILRRQKQLLDKQRFANNTNSAHSPGVLYDVVALFPPDAIITDLDDDLLNILPEDKLLAIAGWNENDGTSIKPSNLADVVFVNLRHKHTADVVEVWESMVEPPVTCGAGNDISLLLHAVQSVLGIQDLSSVVQSMTENQKGMIEGNAIRVIPVSVPGSKASMLVSSHGESKVILQTTADSVCYRYYPKCEVF